MKAGRKPKATHLKVVTGNPGRRPLNKNEPKVAAGPPYPPAHLYAEAKTEWRRISKHLYAIGVLTVLDRAPFAAYCQAYGRWVRAERSLEKMAEEDPKTLGLAVSTSNGNLVQNPLVGTANKALELMLKAASELGMMSPGRSRIEVPDKAKATTPAAEFFA